METEWNVKILSTMFETYAQGVPEDDRTANFSVFHEDVPAVDFSEKKDGSQLCIVFRNAVNYRGEPEPMVFLKKDVVTLSAAQEHLEAVMKARYADGAADSPQAKKLKSQIEFLKQFKLP